MDLIGNFAILSTIDEGRAGAVYKVRDTQLNKIFALKLYRFEPTAQPGDRGLNDGELSDHGCHVLFALTHPHLVAVYNRGVTEEGAIFLVMDWVEGIDLARVLQSEGALAQPRAIDIFIQISDGLAHVHEQGIIHGNLKPSKILFCHRTASGDFVKVADFGLSRLTLTAAREGALLAQAVPDRVFYMSPECCKGESLDVRSDIYSLGCIMYETLSGKPPFVGADAEQIRGRHLRDTTLSFKTTGGESRVPDLLEKVVLRCLEKEPRARYQSMNALRQDLERIRERLEQPQSAGKPCPKCKAPMIFAEDPETMPSLESRDSIFSVPQTGQSIRIFGCGRYETKPAADSNWTTHHACKPMKCECGKAASVSLEGRSVVLHCAQGHDRVTVGRFNLPDF